MELMDLLFLLLLLFLDYIFLAAAVFAVPALRRSSIGTFIRPNSSDGTQPKPVKAQPKLDYRSMISIDDMPELFVSVDSKYLLFFRVSHETYAPAHIL